MALPPSMTPNPGFELAPPMGEDGAGPTWVAGSGAGAGGLSVVRSVSCWVRRPLFRVRC